MISLGLLLIFSRLFVDAGNKKAANRTAIAESTKDDDVDSSEVRSRCTVPLCYRCFEPFCVFLMQLPCEVCHKNDRGEEMLLCDNCDCGRVDSVFGSYVTPILRPFRISHVLLRSPASNRATWAMVLSHLHNRYWGGLRF